VGFGSGSAGGAAMSSRRVQALVYKVVDDVKRRQAFDTNSSDNSTFGKAGVGRGRQRLQLKFDGLCQLTQCCGKISVVVFVCSGKLLDASEKTN
jgi:hypothetical protein